MDEKSMSLTLFRGMSLIELYSARKEGLTPAQVEREMSISRAAARRLLLTFALLGYLENIDGKFFLTAKWLEISGKYLNQNPILDALSKEVITLSDELELPVSIVTLQGGGAMFVCRSPLRRVYANRLAIGDIVPAHASAGRKLILASKTVAQIKDWIQQHGLPQITDRTITDPTRFLSECESIRASGYAISDGELEAGMVSISFPIAVDGETRLAIVISSRSEDRRMTRDASFITHLLERAAAIKDLYTNYLFHGG